MSPQTEARRKNAIIVANNINRIEGVPVTDFAIELSTKWAKGEISGTQMREMLIKKHKRTSL